MMRNWGAFRLPVKKRFTAAVFLFAATCLCQTPKAQPGSPVISLSAVLSWLPADTETIVGANGPFQLPDLTVLGSRQPIPFPKELELRMRMVALGLLDLKNGGLWDHLKSKTILLAVEGSRRFRPPAGLGSMLFEGCLIVVFEGAVNIDAGAFFKDAARSVKRFDTIEGSRIAVFEEPLESDVWTTFVGIPQPNVVLVATASEYMRTVLARMRGAAGPRALPETLAEWKFVDRHAPVWGVRHYQKRDAELDPTSPFQEEAAANIPDNSAVGMTFWFAPVNRRMAVVNYLSANARARQILQDHLKLADTATASPREFQIRLSQPAEGVIEGSVPVSEQEVLFRLIIGLGAMLGHALYL